MASSSLEVSFSGDDFGHVIIPSHFQRLWDTWMLTLLHQRDTISVACSGLTGTELMSLAASPLSCDQPPPFPVRRFTVEEYHRMLETGILTPDNRVELLEGWIVTRMIHHPRHDATIQVIQETLRATLPLGWLTRIQSAITTADSEPEPDIAIVRGDVRSYVSRHPEPRDIGVLVEVAESSLAQDRTLKARLYAAAGIPVYWIVNLIDMHIETYSAPARHNQVAGYDRQETFDRNGLVPLCLDGREVARIPAKDLLP